MDQSARQQLSHWNSTVKQSNLFTLPLQPLQQPEINAAPIKGAASLATELTPPTTINGNRNQTAEVVVQTTSSTSTTRSTTA